MSGWGGEDKGRRGGRRVEIVEVFVWAGEEEGVFFNEGLEALYLLVGGMCGWEEERVGLSTQS